MSVHAAPSSLFSIFFVWAVGAAAAAATNADTSALDDLVFYRPSAVRASDAFVHTSVYVTSLADSLWAAANSTKAEAPFNYPDHAPGLETVLNVSAAAACTGTAANMSNAAGIATLPTSTAADQADLFLGIARDLSFAQCVSVCCSSIGCAALAWYATTDEGQICQMYAAGYITGPQPWPSGHVLQAQGAALTVPAATEDDVANGLRAGSWLGGFATGGYELRADGTFRLSTLRNQSPASEPWSGSVRDMALVVCLDGQARVVRLTPLTGDTGATPGVPQIVYGAAFPVARLGVLNVTIYAYSALTPGDVDTSNTPAVIYTLHVTHDAGAAAPLNVTLALVAGLGLRNDWRQASTGATPLPGGAASAGACAAACVADAGCYAWQWTAASSACVSDRVGYALGANAGGLDSGNPGAFTADASGAAKVVFSTANRSSPSSAAYNGLGVQGLYVLPSTADSGAVTSGVAAAATVTELLALLRGADPAGALRRAGLGGLDALHAAAAVGVTGLAPGGSASLSLAHAWRFPHFFWYRDAFGGSDNGVRYAGKYADTDAVAASLNLTRITRRLREWQGAFAGLPGDDGGDGDEGGPGLLFDAAFNFFAHSKSAVWHATAPGGPNASGGRQPQYRQWESLEFSDWGNPTNGDERHLPYFHALPQALASQLRAWAGHAQNADGSFYCIIESAPGDAQYGNGDPCGGHPPHPDDITMFAVGLAEHLLLGNDTALAAELWPALRAGFGYYATVFNASAWRLPYRVHETYDAVPERSDITGEGNLGYSLFNALQYMTGLHAVRAVAAHIGDAATADAAAALLAQAAAVSQRTLWQPDPAPGVSLPSYLGDTLAEGALLVEGSGTGVSYHSADGLHGQVLAYRLGFGDLLPRTQMQLHAAYVNASLTTPWGTTFDTFAQQNWLMGDHASSALLLRWHEAGAWAPALRQLRYWRLQRRENTRHAAVLSTRTGQYALLNNYGYALFFYHTLSALVGLTADLPARALAVAPHPSAFRGPPGNRTALLPLLLAGDVGLGTVALGPATATLRLLDLGAPGSRPPLSFLTVGVCQHTFTAPAGTPYELAAGGPSVVLALPSECDSAQAASASSVVSAPYCGARVDAADGTLGWAGAALLPPPPPPLANVSLALCQAAAVSQHYCGYEHTPASDGFGACTLVPGSACYIVARARPPGGPNHTLGGVACNATASGYAPPRVVNTSDVTRLPNASFAGPAAGALPVPSPLFSLVLPAAGGEAACAALAAATQACGWIWAPAYAGPAVGSCAGGTGGGSPCCMLNPYRGCVAGPPLPALYGDGTVTGLFGGAGVLPE